MSKVAREYFQENYKRELEAQRLPLVYSRQSYQAVRDSGLHLHEDHYALYLVHGGRGLHEINGHPYAVARGDVYLTPPGTMHAYRDGENLEVDVFVFTIGLLCDDEVLALRSLPGFRGLFATGEDWSTHRLHLTPERWTGIETLVREVRSELRHTREEYSPAREESTASEILARSLFFRLLVQLARLWSAETERSTPPSYRSVELAEVLRFCESHFQEPLSVPQLAAKMFLSPSRFAEIFKHETGVPPGEYLRKLRLNHAQTLLKSSPRSATDIAQECGFRDAAQFSRAFRGAFKMSPSEYRKRYK